MSILRHGIRERNIGLSAFVGSVGVVALLQGDNDRPVTPTLLEDVLINRAHRHRFATSFLECSSKVGSGRCLLLVILYRLRKVVSVDLARQVYPGACQPACFPLGLLFRFLLKWARSCMWTTYSA